MRIDRIALAVAAACSAAGLSACAGNAGGASADLLGGEYSGTTAVGQPLVFDVQSADKVLVNGVRASLDDPATNAAFTVTLNGETEDFSCLNTDTQRTLHCSVHRQRVHSVQVPCENLNSTPSAAPSSTPAAPGTAVFGPALCAVHPPATENVDLLRICTGAPCQQ